MEALKTICARTLVEHLEPLLEDPNNRTRANAVVALHTHLPDAAFATLRDMARSENKWFRLSSVYAAGQVGTPAAIHLLYPLVADSDVDVKIFAIKTLAKLKPPGYTQALEPALSDDDPTVVYYAQKALDEARGDAEADDAAPPAAPAPESGAQ